MNTYFLRHPRGFQNEYTVGIATTQSDAESYAAEGFKRIDRETALYKLTYQGDRATRWYSSVTIDGKSIYDNCPFVARVIRRGGDLKAELMI